MDNQAEDRSQRHLSLSLVVPMYNEADVCQPFFMRVLPIIESTTDDFEIICVNDGSTDETLDILRELHAGNARIKVLNLTRNFGKEIALTAGLEHASGNAVIPLDADLQDPPELIPDMVAKWREGYDSVIAVRSNRQSDSYLKRATASLFYRVIGRVAETPIPANAGDFRLLDRAVVNALLQLPERTRFMKGLYAWVGFSHAYIEYSRPQRVAGTSKWKYWNLWNLALEGIFSFTTLPLRIWTYLGFAIATISGLYGLVIIIRTLLYGADVPGYASLLVTILFLSGVNMVGLGILGEYLGRIFLEVKQRPMYLIGSRIGFEQQRDTPPEI
jgi:glycosyltransferase involved in cell wall biosynthesis